MTIHKLGNVEPKKEEFKFTCLTCGCEWSARRNEVKFTPPCLPYDVYMKCPACSRTVYMSDSKGGMIFYEYKKYKN